MYCKIALTAKNKDVCRFNNMLHFGILENCVIFIDCKVKTAVVTHSP